MERLTKKINNVYVVHKDFLNVNEDTYSGNAINKLAEFENIIEELQLKQAKISKELEVLRKNGETKSVKFRELLGQKLVSSRILTTFELHELI